MTRSTDQWRELLDGTTPGPWGCRWDEGHLAIVGPDEEAISFDADERDSNLIVAAPEAVAEVVRLREELEALRGTLSKARIDIARGDYEYGQHTAFLLASSQLTRILEGGGDE